MAVAGPAQVGPGTELGLQAASRDSPSLRRGARRWWRCRRCRLGVPRPWCRAGAGSRGHPAGSRPGRWGPFSLGTIETWRTLQRRMRLAGDRCTLAAVDLFDCHVAAPFRPSAAGRSRAVDQRMTIAPLRSMARSYPLRVSLRWGRRALDSRRIWRAARVRRGRRTTRICVRTTQARTGRGRSRCGAACPVRRAGKAPGYDLPVPGQGGSRTGYQESVSRGASLLRVR